jgi:hypothetical protein
MSSWAPQYNQSQIRLSGGAKDLVESPVDRKTKNEILRASALSKRRMLAKRRSG